uniref:Uncharacterized protein n=1 Tax=Anguilla anguilla TaxID=7936 RepID=A0A0E9PL21_ANGAN
MAGSVTNGFVLVVLIRLVLARLQHILPAVIL